MGLWGVAGRVGGAAGELLGGKSVGVWRGEGSRALGRVLVEGGARARWWGCEGRVDGVWG